MIAKRWKVSLQGLVCSCEEKTCSVTQTPSSINYYYLFAHNASAAPPARENLLQRNYLLANEATGFCVCTLMMDSRENLIKARTVRI